MRVVSWNCNGGLRNKLDPVLGLAADVAIIQECEDPSRATSRPYRRWASNHLWTGATKSRGLGVFASGGIRLTPLEWPCLWRASVHQEERPLRTFLPCRVTLPDRQSLTLLGIWACQADSPTFGYIGQVWHYLSMNLERLRCGPLLLAGDLNSNQIWDRWDRWWNHSDVVRSLSNLGLESLYHQARGEAQGDETAPTLCFRRHRDRVYHIDYMFGCLAIQSGMTRFEVGAPDQWLTYSDHMPLVLDVDIAASASPLYARPEDVG